MRSRLDRWAAWFTVLLMLCASVPEGLSQSSQRRRPSRRVTNPIRRRAPVPAPTPDQTQTDNVAGDPTLVSSAEDQAAEASRATTPARNRRNSRSVDTDQERTRRTIETLSEQVNKLSDQLSRVRSDQAAMVELERLTRAEQRAEALRTQLRDVLDKEATLQARSEQIDFDLRPESLQQRTALVGTLNADAVRNQARQQLENEQRRVRAQLDVLSASRVRLDTSIATADAETERLRARLDADTRQQIETNAINNANGINPNPNSSPNSNSGNDTGNSRTSPAPTPTPPPRATPPN